MNRAAEIYLKLTKDFGIRDAVGGITFTLKDISIVVNQNNVVGNILEEWLGGGCKLITFHTGIIRDKVVLIFGLI